MENFLLPSKVEFHDGAAPNTGEMVIMPCYHGYGTTLGNALRRVLLSSLPGSAVEHFKVKGAEHEFSTVEGVKEDVVELMLNLKQLSVRCFTEESAVLKISKKGPGLVTAGDIEPNGNVEIGNTDLVIATLTTNKVFEMDITVGQGRGYKPVEEKNRKNYDLGTIVVDSVYTPIKDVGYKVEYTRVGDITNYEKLTISVETNGTISPKDAMSQSTQILMDHFAIILNAANEQMEASLKEVVAEAADDNGAMGGEGDAARETEKKPKKKAVKKK